jgi:hypothetical protein
MNIKFVHCSPPQSRWSQPDNSFRGFFHASAVLGPLKKVIVSWGSHTEKKMPKKTGLSRGHRRKVFSQVRAEGGPDFSRGGLTYQSFLRDDQKILKSGGG